MQSQTNVVLVHGVSADASSLKRFNVTAVQLPLTSLTDDITVTRKFLAAPKNSKAPVAYARGSEGCVTETATVRSSVPLAPTESLRPSTL